MAVTLNDTLGVKREFRTHYDFGMPFWEATRQKKLVIQYCKTAKKFQHFPRPVSIFTGRRRDIEWREVSGKGKVFSFTIAHRGTPPFQGAEPYAIASVTIDEGVNIIADMIHCKAEDLKIGMRVKPYWHPLDERRASADVAAGQGLTMTGPEDGARPEGGREVPAADVGRHRRHVGARPAAPARSSCNALKVNNFPGDIHLVGRSDEPIDGRPVLKSAEELPEGVDLAVFTLPAAGVRDAIEACARAQGRLGDGVRRGLCRGRRAGDCRTQSRAPRATAGLAIVGPNCLGVTNNVDGMMLHMLYAREALRWASRTGVAFVGQSGGMLGHFQRAADGRGMPLSYVISTGNEIGLETTDFLEFLADDAATRVIVVYTEQVRRPQRIPRRDPPLPRRRQAGGADVPGPQRQVAQAAQSHTGALVGDYATMRTLVEDAGAIVVTTMDEMMDLAEILVRFPKPPVKGPGVLTASGAFVGLTNDMAEELGLEFPAARAGDARRCSRRRCRRTATTAIRSTPPPASRRRRCRPWSRR